MDQQGYYTRTDPRLGRRLRMAMFDMDSPAVGEALSRYDEFGREWDAALTPGWTVDPGVYGLHVGDCCVSGVVDASATCSSQLSTTLRVLE